MLPLADLSATGEPGYFADGMTEALIAHLSTASDLRVIARTSVMQFRGARASAGEIAKALNVDAVIEGAVHRAGNRVRVTARLVRGDTQETVWSGTYDRDLPDVLTLQSEVATAILREVEAAVRPQPPARPSPRPVAGDVYDAYLKARFGLNKRNRTPADVQESIRLFEGVIVRDATFAQAHAGLAAAYQASGATSIGALPVVDTIPKAADAARRALALDPQLGEAHRILAQADEQAWRWPSAEAHYRSAIAVDANDASAHLDLGAHLLYQGRIEEGLALARHGRALDPLWPDRTVRLAWLLYQARRYDEAIRELRTVLAADPDQVQALWFLGFALIEASRFDEAVQTAERAVAVWDRNPAALSLLARAYARAGRARGRRRHHRRAAAARPRRLRATRGLRACLSRDRRQRAGPRRAGAGVSGALEHRPVPEDASAVRSDPQPPALHGAVAPGRPAVRRSRPQAATDCRSRRPAGCRR